MSLNGILKLLEGHPEFRGSLEAASSGQKPEVTVRQGARATFIASLARRADAPTLVITPRPEDARRLHDQLLSWLGEDSPVYLLPEPEVLPFERLAVDGNTSNQRLATLAALAAARYRDSHESGEGDGCQAPVVVCSIGSALLYTAPPDLMAGTVPSPGRPYRDQRAARTGTNGPPVPGPGRRPHPKAAPSQGGPIPRRPHPRPIQCLAGRRPGTAGRAALPMGAVGVP